MIEHSLARLELGFVLGREQNNQCIYQVPLFQEMILNESPATKLSREIEGWNAKTLYLCSNSQALHRCHYLSKDDSCRVD